MRVIDAHLHLWDLDRNPYPWLQGPDTQSFFGDNTPLRRTFLTADLDREASPWQIGGVVHVQANWAPSDPVGESAWLASVAAADAFGRPNALVAYADLCSPALDEMLDGHARYPALRGIRQTLHRAALPGGAPDLLSDPAWLRGLSRLSARDLCFDMMIFPSQAVGALAAIRANPRLRVMLEHTGCPPLGDAGGMEGWRVMMRAMAAEPNVWLKIGGLGMFDRDWAAGAGDVVREAIDLFGPARCMFGSNFPVDQLAMPLARIWTAFDQMTRNYGKDERAAMFYETATMAYRLES